MDIRWSLFHRVGFRFVFSYYVLFAGIGFILRWLPYGQQIQEQYGVAWLATARWIASHVLGWEREIYTIDGGIGVSNSAFGTVMFFSYLVLAAVATAVWSVLDRRRPHYARLHEWFRLFVRISLAMAMIRYGVLKVIPVQMIAPPTLGILTQRVGTSPGCGCSGPSWAPHRSTRA